MENKNVPEQTADTKTSKKRNPFLSVLFGFLNAILIVFLSLWIELTVGTVFVSEISKDIDYEQFFVLSFLDINEFAQSVAPLIICIVFIVLTTALIFVTNLKKIRTSFLSIGISFAVCSVINLTVGLLSPICVDLLPNAFVEMVANKVTPFGSLMLLTVFPLLIAACLAISVFLVIGYAKEGRKKSFKRKLIGLVAGFVCVVIAFSAVGCVVLIPKKSDVGTSKYHLDDQIAKLTKENEDIDFDEESGALYINCEVIVEAEIDADESDIEALADKQDARLDKSMSDIGIYKFTYPEAMSYDDLGNKISKLKKNEFVKDAYFNTVTLYDTETDDSESTAVYPDDDWKGDNWNNSVPRGKNWGLEAINAPDAWSYLDQMETVRVGLIDCVPNTKHPDLVNMFKNTSFICINSETGVKEINAYDIPPQNDHGSHVSGIMDADWDNGIGVSGVMGGKGDLYFSGVYYDGGYGLLPATGYDFLLALKELIDQDVQVINISLGVNDLIVFAASRGNKNAISFLTERADFLDAGLTRIISQREEQGKSDFVICVAAGNTNHLQFYKDDAEAFGYRDYEIVTDAVTGNKADSGNVLANYGGIVQCMTSEAVTSRLIVVGAAEIDTTNSTRYSTRYSYAFYSNTGSRVDIVAPGSDIYSCYDEGYDLMSGTSMATPHVSGVAGLVFACNPDLTGPEVKEILLASTTGRYYYYDGYAGMVNAKLAVVNAIQTKDKPVSRVIRSAEAGGLDLCFVVDTTGSMGDDIDNAKANMTDILSHLSEKTSDYRVAIIDYRDFPSRTGDYNDYPYKIQLDFSSNNSEIESAINRLGLGYGGDDEETVYSGLMAAVDLDWRPTAKKVIIVLGDAAPLDPEPETGYTYDDVVCALLSSDIGIDYGHSDSRVTDSMDFSAISVYSIGTSASYAAEDFFEDIALDTGGSYSSVADATGVSDAIIDSIEQIEITSMVSAKADFGAALADTKIDIYQGGTYLFSIDTDERGAFELENVEPDMYHWECPELFTSGSMEIDNGEKFASIRTKQEYWFNPMITTWSEQKTKIVPVSESIALFVLFVPLLIAMAIVKLSDNIRKKRAAAPKPVSQPVAVTQPVATTVATAPATPVTTETAPPVTTAVPVAAATATVASDDEIVAPKRKRKNNKEIQLNVITCPNCGKTLDSSDSFCGYCGATIDDKK